MGQEKRKALVFRHFLQSIQRGTHPFRTFRTKVSNDWMMSSAAGLAYHLINALIPMAILLFVALSMTLGRLDPLLYARLVASIKNAFPSPVALPRILEPAFAAIRRDAGVLTALSLLVAIFGGSRLFITIEGYFDIIYQTDMRKTLAQNAMALLMVALFLILIPLTVFASSIPALLLVLLQHATINRLPALVFGVASVLESLVVSWILFETIYLIVPNRKISFKKSWRGAVVAALLLELFLVLFPFYVTHFMGGYTGTIGFIFLLLFFFYYFAAILLFGAEVNAFYAEGVHALPANLATFIYRETHEEVSKEVD